MAHQWFGDAVTERAWAHLWLSEGFATYFAALWTRESEGRGRLSRPGRRSSRKSARRHRRRAAARDRHGADGLHGAPQREQLRQGRFVLSMLHRELGDSAFFRGIRSY
jgi:aminopeptidase N